MVFMTGLLIHRAFHTVAYNVCIKKNNDKLSGKVMKCLEGKEALYRYFLFQSTLSSLQVECV
jgi:hypothetical protein